MDIRIACRPSYGPPIRELPAYSLDGIHSKGQFTPTDRGRRKRRRRYCHQSDTLRLALEYKPQSVVAPRVVAKGQDLFSKKDKDLGRENDIPTAENVRLALALYRVTEVD
jgi:type III secretion system FlhB-like substrate exporter